MAEGGQSRIYDTDCLSTGGSFTDILFGFVYDTSVNERDQTRYPLLA